MGLGVLDLSEASLKKNPEDVVIKLKKFQTQFIKSEARYPAFVGAWATGKSMSGIIRGMNLSEEYPFNLGVVFRKEFVDLRDSTVKDFETYTGLKVNSAREVKLSNGSQILFRHLEELNNIQNMNLGWFWIEQAEELLSDREFFTLFGRLRRAEVFQTGFVTANVNGHDWIEELWNNGKLEGGELVEAKTEDNSDILTKEYVNSLEQVKKNRPEIYKRFVLNDRNVSGTDLIVIPVDIIRKNIHNVFYGNFQDGLIRKITVCDVAGEGTDECVIYNLENGKMVSQEIYAGNSLMDTCGRIQAHALKHGSNLICVDKVCEGAGVYSRLKEIYTDDMTMKIYGFDGRVSAPEGLDNQTYENYKTYAWFKAAKYLQELRGQLFDDPELVRQLSGVRYIYKSNSKIALETKEKIKAILKCSPGRADALVMGIDALSQAQPVSGARITPVKQRSYVPERFRPQSRRFAYA